MPQTTKPSDPRTVAEQEAQASTERHIASILRIPQSQCPWPAVRLAMLRLAIEGATIYAYGVFERIIYTEHADGTATHLTPAEWALAHGYDVTSEEASDAANNH